MTILKTRHALWSAGLCGALMLAAGPAAADKIKNPTAVFAGLDKITGRIISFEAAIDETVQFGSLQITPRVCYTRPLTEAPQTDVFAEVDEVGQNKDYKRIFSGWMFAASPRNAGCPQSSGGSRSTAEKAQTAKACRRQRAADAAAGASRSEQQLQ